MIIPWYYKLLIGAVAGTALWIGGMLYERANLAEFKGEVKGAAQVQGKITQAANAANKGEANVSQTELMSDLQAVHTYYAKYPVIRLRIVHGACTVSGPADNTQGIDGAAPSLYATACSPESVSVAGETLKDLQDRLRAAATRGAVVIQ